MASADIIIKVFKLSRTTTEAKEIRMFQADEEIMNSYGNFQHKIALLFENPEECMNLFWKGR